MRERRPQYSRSTSTHSGWSRCTRSGTKGLSAAPCIRSGSEYDYRGAGYVWSCVYSCFACWCGGTNCAGQEMRFCSASRPRSAQKARIYAEMRHRRCNSLQFELSFHVGALFSGMRLVQGVIVRSMVTGDRINRTPSVANTIAKPKRSTDSSTSMAARLPIAAPVSVPRMTPGRWRKLT